MNTAPKFINVKVIGSNIKPEVYQARDPNVPRGHKDYIMSRGELHDFSANPRKWLLGIPNEDTAATDWGSLIDLLALTPERFESDYAVCPETYQTTGMECPYCKSVTDSKKCSNCKADRVPISIEKPWNANATQCDNWIKEQTKAGKTIVKKKDLDEARKAIEMLKNDKQLCELIACSQTQMMIMATYRDHATGLEIPVKILLDLVPDANHPRFGQSLGDLKTARSADFHAWDNAVGEHWYDAQAALYSDIYAAAFPKESRIDWRFAIQENEPPYVTGRRTMSEEFMDIGRAKYLNALKDYCVCLKTGVWPSYDDIPSANNYNGWTMCQPKEWMIGAAYGLGLKAPESKPEKVEVERNDLH